jgi:8-oxo-dGTP diphosphatase
MQAKIVAKAVIQDADKRVLLLRRSKTDPLHPGQWDFPGGGVDIGEDVFHGVMREIHEEAGLTVEHTDLVLIYGGTERYETASVTRLLFFATVQQTDILLSSEHDHYEWVSPAEVLEKFPHPFYGAGLKYALDNHLVSA